MSKIEEQNTGKKEGEIRYLTPLNIDTSTQNFFSEFKTRPLDAIDVQRT